MRLWQSHYETVAIATYLDLQFGGPRLTPTDPSAQAKMLQWISVINAYIYPDAITNYVLQYVYPRGENNKPDRRAIDAALPLLGRDLRLFEQTLSDKEYLVGSLSLADLFFAPIHYYLGLFPESQGILADLPALQSYGERMAQRESYIKTLPAS